MCTKVEPRAERYSVQFGGERIDFLLSYGDRKRLSISVHPDQSVTVKSPQGRTLEAVLGKVRKRGAWIVKQREYFERFQPLPPAKQYVSGETHLYLGRQYRLKVVKDESETAKLKGRFLYVYTRNKKDRSKVRGLVRGWYLDHARALLSHRFEVCLETAKRFRIPRPRVLLRRMRRRWGSCTKSRNIVLNTELVRAPLHCIDYVIMHELCHLKFPDHGKGFYRLLSRCMPDWERRKQRLEQVIF